MLLYVYSFVQTFTAGLTACMVKHVDYELTINPQMIDILIHKFGPQLGLLWL